MQSAIAAAPSWWYLIQCKPRQDARELENLQRQGFECYAPAQPLPVRPEVIDAIRRRVGVQHPRPYFRPGDRVVINNGCFSELEAVFIADDGERRVMLLLTLLQQEHTLSFPISGVRRAG